MVENTSVVVSDIKKIVASINKGCFWEEFEITVDFFEILTDTTDKEPCFVNYKDVSYFPKIVDNKDIKTVDIIMFRVISISQARVVLLGYQRVILLNHTNSILLVMMPAKLAELLTTLLVTCTD